MKIEEIEDKNKANSDKYYKYWFPLSKGYNRLLIVLACIIMIMFFIKTEELVVLFVIAFIEICIYITLIWVYRGFKDLD